MGLIMKSAKLSMCERCHTHGRIVFSDESTSPSFATQERGYEILDEALLKGKVVDAEAEFVRMQIGKFVRVTSSPALDDVMEMFFNDQELDCRHGNPFGSGPYMGSQMMC